MLFFTFGPLAQFGIPVVQAFDRRSFDDDAEIVPPVLGRRSKVIVGDVKAPEHRFPAICDDHFLVVADEIAPGPLRRETQEFAARFDQRLQKCIGRIGTEAINDEGDPDPAPCRRNERIAKLRADRILGKYVKADVETFPCARNEIEQRLPPVLPARIESEMLARCIHFERLRIGKVRAGAGRFDVSHTSALTRLLTGGNP